jgi:hypothetical protein
MRGVDHGRDPMLGEPSGEGVRTPETADADVADWEARARDPAGQGAGDRDAARVERCGQLTCLTGPAEDQDHRRLR